MSSFASGDLELSDMCKNCVTVFCRPGEDVCNDCYQQGKVVAYREWKSKDRTNKRKHKTNRKRRDRKINKIRGLNKFGG